MSRRKKIWLTIAGSIAGLIVILVVSSILVLRSAWFANYVREKIISVTEESTGGTVEIGAFQFDWTHLTARIRNFVLHGTETAASAPLVRIPLLEVQLKLFSGIKHAIDLNYVGIQSPAVNLLVYADGTTNIPEPKIKKQPSQTSGLETVVDLEIGRFEIDKGLIQVAQQKTGFSARGENLQALLNYNVLNPRYQGNLSIDPLVLSSGAKPPLNVHVNLPVTIEKDAVTIAGAKLTTDQSQILVSGSISHMNAPVIDARLNASVSLPEIVRSAAVPIDATARGAPKTLTAEFAGHMDTNIVQIRTAHVALGQTTFQASGTIQKASHGGGVQFNANLALAELSRLLKMTSVAMSGATLVNGEAQIDAHNNYAVNGTVNTRDVSVRSGSTRISSVSFFSPFHADPYLISLDGLKLRVLGGDLSAKIFVENLQRLSVEGNLGHFDLPLVAAVLTGKRLDYAGWINGSIKAKGNLAEKGTRGYVAQANLTITPGTRGVPVSGRLDAAYNGAADVVSLDHSYIAMPHSQIDISGSLNRRIDVNLTSRNLNDFLPAANFGAAKPESSLPVTLQGGIATIAAQITGNLATPRITSHVAINRFAVEQRAFNSLSADLEASPSEVSIANGQLTRKTLRTTFDASIGLQKWSPTPASPLTANLAMRNGDVADLLALAGESSIPASGDVSADVHIRGVYGNPQGSAILNVTNASAYQQSIDRLYANVRLTDQLVTLSSIQVASGAAHINISGTFRHPRDSFMVGHAQVHVASSNVQLANIKPLQNQNAGIAGLIQLTADAAADVNRVQDQPEVKIANVTADLSARGLRVQNQDAGDLTAAARTAGGAIQYNVNSNFAGSTIQVNGRTGLEKAYPTTATASIKNLSIEKALLITGEGAIPARGTLSADARVAGTIASPNADLSLALTHANVYQEPIDHFAATVHYSTTTVNISSLELNTPAGDVSLAGSFSHPASNFTTGALNLKMNSTDIQLAKIHHVQEMETDLTGTLHLAADLSADIQRRNGGPAILFSHLNADASARALRMNARNLGEASLSAHTSGTNLSFRLDSDIAQSQIHGSGEAELAGDYPVSAKLAFANIKYSNLAPFVSSTPEVRPSFDAQVAGQASVSGPTLKPDALTGRLVLTQLEAHTVPTGSPTGAPPGRSVRVENQGPVVVSLSRSVIAIQQFRLEGPGTSLNATGAVDLTSKTSPVHANVTANINLGTLQDVSRDFYSSGSVSMDTSIRGSFKQPLVNGRIELKNANVNYTESPNGIANGNGVILLNGTSASIQHLTAESGGGKITLAGFVGFTGTSANYNLRATANKVRTRYSGVSVVSNATLRLTGNTNRSLLQGNVSVQRIAYEASSDAGSFLSKTSAPPSTPATPSGIVAGMRLDIQIVTAPDLRVISTYAQRLEVEANLRVRGTLANPGVIGRVTVTDGQLVFFGNEYTVNTGTINFYNPTSIQPVINISLETIAQGVDVTLAVTGPMDNLKLSYRSDPPLTFEQIVELLATNKTPQTDPTIAAHQPTPPQQSFTEMGESALLGQAIANPLANRLQRVFGITQLKIDPSLQGANGQPTARVSLTQQITQNLTFSYTEDVSVANSEIVRVEWAFTPKLSAVALRDYNGNVSLQFFYKFSMR